MAEAVKTEDIDVVDPADAPDPAKALPPRDPETGKFLKPAAPATPTYTHPARLVAMAKDFDFGDEEIATTPTPELREIIRDLHSHALLKARDETYKNARDRDIERAGSVQPVIDAAGPAVVTGAPAPSPQKPAALDWGKDDDGTLFNETTLSAPLVRVIEALHARIHELEAQAESQAPVIQQLTQREVAREARTRDEMFDRAFSALGDKYERYFGKGALGELKDDGEKRRRVAIVKAAGIDGKDNQAALSQKVKAAAEEMYAPVVTSAYEAAVAPTETGGSNGKRVTEEQWRGAGLAAPTQRTVPEPSEKGTASAVKAVAETMKAKGFNTNAELSDEEASIPD